MGNLIRPAISCLTSTERGCTGFSSRSTMAGFIFQVTGELRGPWYLAAESVQATRRFSGPILVRLPQCADLPGTRVQKRR